VSANRLYCVALPVIRGNSSFGHYSSKRLVPAISIIFTSRVRPSLGKILIPKKSKIVSDTKKSTDIIHRTDVIT
jgi:hypothetical protein